MEEQFQKQVTLLESESGGLGGIRQIPNYLPTNTTPLLTGMNQIFFKQEEKTSAVIKPASKFSLAQNSKFCRVYPCNILDKKRQEIIKKDQSASRRNMSSDTTAKTEVVPLNESFKPRDRVPSPLIPIHASTRRVKLKELQGTLKKRLQSQRDEAKGPSITEADESLVISKRKDEDDDLSPQAGASLSPRTVKDQKIPKFLIDYMAGKPSTKTQQYKHKSKQPAPRALAKFDIHPAADKALHSILISDNVDCTPQGNIFYFGAEAEGSSSPVMKTRNKKQSGLSFRTQSINRRTGSSGVSPKTSQRFSHYSGDDDRTPVYGNEGFSSKYARRLTKGGGFPAIPEVMRTAEDREVSETGRLSDDMLPELTLKRVVKENPKMKEKMRLSSLAEVAQRYVLEKQFEKMLGTKNVLSGLSEYEYQQLLYLAPHIQKMEQKLSKEKQRGDQQEELKESSYAYFSAPPIERAQARFKKIVQLSGKHKQERSLLQMSVDEKGANSFTQPPMSFQFSVIPGQEKKKKQFKPGSSPARTRMLPGKKIAQLKETMTFKRGLQEPAHHRIKRKSVQEGPMSGRKGMHSSAVSPATETGEGGQSIYKVEIEKDEIGEAIKQLMDRGDEPRMDIEKARRGMIKQKPEERQSMGQFVSLPGEEKPKEQFDEDLAKLLNEYRPKVTLWKSTLGDKLFLLDNVDKVKGHSFDELQKQLKQITKMQHHH